MVPFLPIPTLVRRYSVKLTIQSTSTASAAVLSALTSAGGVYGYVKAGSVPSVTAGLSIGAVYLAAFARLYKGKTYGEELALLASIVLGGHSIPRAVKTKKRVSIALSIIAAYGIVIFGLASRAKRV